MKNIGSGAILVLSLAACGSQATGGSGETTTSGDPSAPEVDLTPSPTNGPSSAARINKIPFGEEGAWTGNIVPGGGRVLVDFGPMHDVLSADPMKHIFLRGNPGSADRVFLAASVLDTKLGITFDFELDYTDEATPIDLVQHGRLNLIDRGPPQLATAGQVTVSKAGAGRLSLKFTQLQLGTEDSTGTMILSTEPLADGIVIGDVERVCRNGLAADADNPFCDGQD